MTDNSQVKVLIQDDDNVETLWAERVGPDRYRLDNSPFFAYGVSWQDIIEARPADDGMLTFVRVVEKAGHRTVRVILDPGADRSLESQAVLDGLVALGASYEGANPRYLAIDIPPKVALDSIVEYLVASGCQWEYGDPRYSDLFPEEQGEGRLA